jgi:hypothetical protein
MYYLFIKQKALYSRHVKKVQAFMNRKGRRWLRKYTLKSGSKWSEGRVILLRILILQEMKWFRDYVLTWGYRNVVQIVTTTFLQIFNHPCISWENTCTVLFKMFPSRKSPGDQVHKCNILLQTWSPGGLSGTVTTHKLNLQLPSYKTQHSTNGPNFQISLTHI